MQKTVSTIFRKEPLGKIFLRKKDKIGHFE